MTLEVLLGNCGALIKKAKTNFQNIKEVKRCEGDLVFE